jgi:alpha-ribazole phosphatase
MPTPVPVSSERPAAPRLWLLRHAAVEGAPGLCYGASDLAAQPAATRAAADAFARRWPAAMESYGTAASRAADDIRLWCSPLRRCTALAAAVVERMPRLGPVRVDPRLAEMDFGAWEGRPWDAIGRDAFDAWTADFADARAGEHGESTRMFMARVGAAWDAWRASGRDAVWVTHAGVMRAVMLLQRDIRCPVEASEWPQRSISFGAWICVKASI